MSDGRPNRWQRRYLLAHYRECDDAMLATGSGLSAAVVRAFLDRMGATRGPGDLRRIAAAGPRPVPEMLTPARARRAITRVTTRPLTLLDALLIVVMFLGSAILYALTCARTVTGEDAGELLAAAHGFGVPHPPGYPLWLILSWAADHAASWVSVAWRISMVSAVFSAAANAVLLAIALKTLRSRLAAVSATALFAVSLTHWTQAVIPEVYGLNTLFLALQTLLLVRLAERPSGARLIALAAVTGLSLTNHTSAFPVAAVLALGAALVAPGLLRSPRVVVGSLLAGLLPLALFLVLPLASARQPFVDWGNPETADALWAHVTRTQYAEVQAGQQATGDYGDYLQRLAIMGDGASRQFGSGWVLLLAALGVGTLFVRQTGLWLLMLSIGWLCSVGITRYSNFPFEREHIYAVQIFWIPAWLVLAWLVGGGLDAAMGAARSLAGPTPSSLRRRAVTALAGAACLALIALPAAEHFTRADRSRTTLIADFGRAILDAMDEGALYFPSSDHSTFAVLYQQGVLGYRTDVVIADKYGRLDDTLVDPLLDETERQIRDSIPPGRRRAFEESVLIRKWPGSIYFANRREMADVPGRTLEPVGPIYKVMTPDEARAWWAGAGGDPPGIAASDRILPLLDTDARQRLDFTVQMVHADLLTMRGLSLLHAGRLAEARAVWARITGDLAPLKQAFNNIGAALAEHGELADAVESFGKARAEDPRYVLALRNEALVRKNRGERPLAIARLRDALAVAPDDRTLRLELAHLLQDEGKLLDALSEYETLAAADENDPVPWRDAGRLLETHGDLVKAQDAYAESLRLDPDQQDIAERLQRLRSGVAALDEFPEPTLGDEHDGAAEASAPALPRLPGDPAEAVHYDPLRGALVTARP